VAYADDRWSFVHGISPGRPLPGLVPTPAPATMPRSSAVWAPRWWCLGVFDIARLPVPV